MRTGSTTLNWLLGDHLGSTALTADSAGNKLAELRYKAWGENHYSSGTTPTSFKYSAQREDTGLGGVMFYNARWYDPAVSRFLQADTLVPGASNPQRFSRYTFVLNNPLKYTDPTGHMEESENEGYCVPGNDYCGRAPEPTTTSTITSTPDDPNQPTIGPAPNASFPPPPKGAPALPWEFGRLSGIGARGSVSGWLWWLPVLGGDISVDGIYNFRSSEFSLFVTPSALLGLGAGGSVSGGVVGLYDAVENASYSGWSTGVQGTIVPEWGAQASWSESDSPGSDGRYASAWQAGPGGGAELSASLTKGYTLEIFRIDFKAWNIRFLPGIIP
jgi:RHS repeat-associated protein